MTDFGHYSDLAQRILNYSLYSQEFGKLGLIQNKIYQEEPHVVLRETLEHHLLDKPQELRRAVITSLYNHHIEDKVEQSLLLYGSFGVANEAPTDRATNPKEYLTKLFDHFQIPYSLEQAKEYMMRKDGLQIDMESFLTKE